MDRKLLLVQDGSRWYKPGTHKSPSNCPINSSYVSLNCSFVSIDALGNAMKEGHWMFFITRRWDPRWFKESDFCLGYDMKLDVN